MNHTNITTNNSDGSYHHHHQVNLFVDHLLVNTHLICILIGLPLNVTIILCIMIRRRLHQPRKIIWAGIALSNIFILSTQMAEVYTFFSSNETWCRIRTFLIGLPYVALLMNQFLSLIDRYVCISYPLWYQTFVNIPWTLVVQFSSIIFLCFSMKGHYIVGHVPITCEIYPADRKVFFGFILFFFLLCVIGQLILFLKAKSLTSYWNNNGSSSQVTFSVVRSRDRIINNNEGVTVSMCQPIRHRITVTELELEAARNVVIGVGSLCVFATPWLISSVLLQTCAANSGGQVVENCGNYGWAASYNRELFVIHSVYHSVFYAIRSRDFC